MPRKRLMTYLCIVIVLFGCAYGVRALTFRPVCKLQYRLASEHTRGIVELEKEKEVPGYIDFSVQSVEITGDSKYYNSTGKVTLEICSPEDVSMTLFMMSQQSQDNLGGSSSKKVELKADVPQTVTMYYQGWGGGGYWLTINASNGENRYAHIVIYM